MNDLDREIRRAFDELVGAAPPPPLSPSQSLQRSSKNGRAGYRALASVVSLLLIVAVGVAVLAQRVGVDDTFLTLDEPQPSQVVTTLAPVQSASTATPAESVDSTAPTSIVEPVVGEYELAAGQTMPGSTEPIPAPGEAYDGIYFAYLHEGAASEDPQQLRFDVLQAFSGADCAIRFGDEAPSVCTPIGTDIAGSTDRVDLAVAEVAVSVRDLNSEASYQISGGELVALVYGAAPATSAPDGFAFSGGFGFLLTYDAGTLIRIDQPASLEAASTLEQSTDSVVPADG